MAGASTFAMMLRLFVSLAVVIALMIGITAFLRRRGIAGFAPTRARRGAPIVDLEVLARKQINRTASIAIVRAGSKSMVVGITDTNITMLGEADIDLEALELEAAEAQGTGLTIDLTRSSQTWKTMLENLRDKTVRRV